jgi:hypothetical protein
MAGAVSSARHERGFDPGARTLPEPAVRALTRSAGAVSVQRSGTRETVRGVHRRVR